MADVFDRLGEISGGDVGDAGGTSGIASLEELVTDETGVLAVAYGEHLVGGHLVAHKYQAGPPPASTVIVAGGEGEWDSVVAAWYAGEALSSSPDGATAGYHFHPGTISTGIADAVQGVDSFLSTGLAYSGTAYLAVKLPDKFATEDRPDKLRWRAKCKKVYDYDRNGVTGALAYSTNPARIAADRIRRYYEQRYPVAATALARFQAAVDWAAWVTWRDYCDTLITWNDGTDPNRQIKRFECHLVLLHDSDLASALDAVCATAAAFWQHDGARFIFHSPAARAPVHHFHPGNITTDSLALTPLDVRSRPNYLTAKFRNMDDPYLTETMVEVKRQPLIDRVGGKVSPGARNFANMTISQAQRLLERQMRLESDNPVICTLRGQADALHVLPGDFVTVSHPVPDWSYQCCLVLARDVLPAERTADETEFTLQAVSEPLYRDTDHAPVQPALSA